MGSQTSPVNRICEAPVLGMRVEAVAQAQKRSRAAFLASTVVSLAIIITIWNAYWSWYRGFLFSDNFAASEVTREAQKTFIDEWVKSLKVSIPLLGIQVGIGDGAVLGSLSLYIICIWLFLSMRRENHTIGLLLRETKHCERAVRNMVFHGIVSFAIFTTVTEIDAPIVNLDDLPSKPRRTVPFVRITYKFLIWLPALTIIFMFIMDWATILWLSAPLREGHLPLWKIMNYGDWIKRSMMELFCFALCIFTGFLCLRIVQYNNGTEQILVEYYGTLGADEAGIEIQPD